MNRKTLAAAFVLLAGPALAEEISYNFIEIGYQRITIDNVLGDQDIDGDGFEIAAAVELGEHWFLAADYSQGSFDYGIDLDQALVGAGFHVGMTPATDFYAALSYVRVESAISGFGSDDEDGYGITAGVRGLVTERFELQADITYIDFGDDGDVTAYGVSGTYNFTPRFAGAINIEVEDEAKGYGVGLRYYFGT